MIRRPFRRRAAPRVPGAASSGSSSRRSWRSPCSPDAPRALRFPRRGPAVALSFLSRRSRRRSTYETARRRRVPPLVRKALEAARRTLLFAAAARSLAWFGGFVLGFLGSTAWWRADPVPATSPLARLAGVLAPRSVGSRAW